MRHSTNWNIFASSLLIAAWKKLGVRHYFVSPGYRNAPFVAALQSEEGLELVSCVDERAAAYQALGCAKASGRAVVLLCTSGTAGANYLPALIEASVDQWPLIVVTADRPFELVHAAAQQVIDQRNLYGRFVKKSFDFPAPSPALAADAWVSYARELLETAESAPEGPVHINLPFQAPLDPVASHPAPGEDAIVTATRSIAALRSRAEAWPLETPRLTPPRATTIQASLRESQRGLIILGRLRGRSERDAAAKIAALLGWPCFADVGSGLKGRIDFEIFDLTHPSMKKSLEVYAPDFVLHLGRRLVSRHFDDFLQEAAPKEYWVLSPESGVQDPHHAPQRLQSTLPIESLVACLEGLSLPRSAAALELRRRTDLLAKELSKLESPSFGFAVVARTLLEEGGASRPLFLANSTAIRAFDSWIYEWPAAPQLEANRGVSGIEGLVATTLGLSRGDGQAWTCVIGDIALIHDLSSLLLLRDQAQPLVVVLVNNQGGRIFETLPLQNHAWVKDPLISTPHSLQFAGIAAMAGISYKPCHSQEELRAAYAEALRAARPALIECLQEPDADLRYQRALRHVEIE